MEQIDTTVPPSGHGCVECDELGSWWVHLRRCASCGHVGCCDDSLNRHASAHAHASGHHIAQSFEPGEDWFWDYRAEQFTRGPMLKAPGSRPETQSAPGPAERLPADWRSVLARRAAR